MAAPSSYFGQPSLRPAGDPELRARDQRLESLKAVVGKLAHDFNNFLVPQFGYITLLKEELASHNGAAQYLATMNNAARTTEGYIESVLLAMRPQRQFAPKPLELGTMLNAALDRWIADLPPGIGLEVKRNVDPISFNGDERHWNKVFEHLLSNARHALASGGVLEVTLGPASLPAAECDRLGLETGEVFLLRFSDNGFGMPEEDRVRAFEPFFTTRGQTRGSGLGLTIVHTIAHFYGGQVELASREDAGATVTLWVPLQTPASARAAMAGLLRQRAIKKKKVLLLEPDAVLREALRSLLAAENLDSQSCENLAEAAKVLKRDPKAISLIMGEAELPDGNTLGTLGADAATIPAVLFAQREKAAGIAAAENIRVMTKPLALKPLRELVRSALEPAA